MKKLITLLLVLAFIFVGQPAFQPGSVEAQSTTYYVATNGSDSSGNGSSSRPWATIGFALSRVSDGSLILVRPGQYNGQIRLNGTFSRGVTVRSEVPYQARLRNNGQVVTSNGGVYGITVEGFDIAHSGPGSNVIVVKLSGGNKVGSGRNITLRNNILHDSYNNDILKVDGSASKMTIEGNIFYNQTGSDEHIDVNSAIDIVIQDNIFFNDFGASGRSNKNDTGSYIVIKDSSGTNDELLGSRNITVRRNVFLNWQGYKGSGYVLIGEDGKNYYEAQDIMIENNLMLGNSKNVMLAPLAVHGARNITFRHNTVVGDLPAGSFSMQIASVVDNPVNEGLYFYNNIWSDPYGTMGADSSSSSSDFSDTVRGHIRSFKIDNNLYWNGSRAVPSSSGDVINYTDDGRRIVANPVLPVQDGLVPPAWDARAGRFADGSRSIREAFVRLVSKYGTLGPNSAASGAGNPAYAPADDILRNPRSGATAMGALESGSSMSLRAAYVGDETVILSWSSQGDLPAGTQWEVVYEGPGGSPGSPVAGLSADQRSLRLTNLRNYYRYAVTVTARDGGKVLMRATTQVMPTDRLVYLPGVLR
jgi:hypothetical protein